MAKEKQNPSGTPAKRSVLTGRVIRRSSTSRQTNTLASWVKTGSPLSSIDGSIGEASSSEPSSSPASEAIVKSQPCGSPPAWSESRTELCETLPWYRSVQSGCYHYAGICYGVLVDADSGDRSYIDEEVVITRIGGGCEKDKDGKLVQVKDKTLDDAAVSYMVNTMERGIPVGLILGNKNRTCGIEIPHRYNVMDFFRITDIWFELRDGKSAARIRFEKWDLSSKSWWAPEGTPDPVPLDQRMPLSGEYSACHSCSETSPRVYAQAWTCLQPKCSEFWKVNGTGSKLVDLTFAQSFLDMRSSPQVLIKPPYSLVPDLLSTFSATDADVLGIRALWKGVVCYDCGRCIARKHWRGWFCETKGCDFRREQTGLVSLRSVLQNVELGAAGHRVPYIGLDNEQKPITEYLKHYRKDTFEVPGIGVITHFAANNIVNSRTDGPNDMFVQLQKKDLELKRYPLSQAVVQGTLTAHFAVNFGMPYKYVVSVDSTPFNRAPPVIHSALGRLTWATRNTVRPQEFQQPNELLTLGYFQDMAIGFHDDGEDSLGPTIATLSLGCPAKMSVRMKRKYFTGYTKSKDKPLPGDPVVPGCRHYEQRAELLRQLKAREISQAEYDKSLREILAKKATKGEGHNEAKPFCVMELNHGDLVVMHGNNLQKYFEHKVEPGGRLRFALTARYVRPDKVDQNDHWKGELDPDPKYEYDGDEQ